MNQEFVNYIYQAGPDLITGSMYPGFDITADIDQETLKSELGAKIPDRCGNVFQVVQAGVTLAAHQLVALKPPTADTVLNTGTTLCLHDDILGTSYYHTLYLSTGSSTDGRYEGAIWQWDIVGATFDTHYKGERRIITSHYDTHYAQIATKAPTKSGWSNDVLTNSPTTSATGVIIEPHVVILAKSGGTGSEQFPIGVALGAVTAYNYTLILVEGYYAIKMVNCSSAAVGSGEGIEVSTTAGSGKVYASGDIAGYSTNSEDYDLSSGNCPAYIHPA